MKANVRHIMLLLVLFAGGLESEIHGQSAYDSSLTAFAQSFPENLVVFTDRTLYAVNEDIRFSALLQSGNESYQGLGSRVLYVELVNSTGTAVAKGKFPLKENSSGGHLSIPSNLLSGLYYVRSYTRWMRNFGSQDFSYIPIRVVNPYSNELVEAGSETGKDALLSVPKSHGIVSISLDGSPHPAGTLIDLEISLEEGINTHIEHGCISVVPAGSIDTTIFRYKVNSKPGSREAFHFNFLPEIYGTSISGIVSERNTQEPVSDMRIHFSILGEDAAYFVTRSDQAGRFVIAAPVRTGNMEMFVVPEYQPGTPVEIRIDNDFTSDPLPFHPDIFQLSQEEEILASRMSLHMQLRNAFLADSGIGNAIPSARPESLPFYGRPEISVKIDDFVNLPNLEEVIENLIPKTFVVRRGGEVKLVIDSENPMISMFPPLVMIDHIPVFDMEVIMAIPPSKLAQIDVIPEVYVLGEVRYGGIISLTSLEGDLASIKLPEGAYFFDYLAYQPSLIPPAARYKGPAKIPDTRNTQFWADDLVLHQDRPINFNFQAARIPGTYLILFRGVSSEGNIVYGMETFEVE